MRRISAFLAAVLVPCASLAVEGEVFIQDHANVAVHVYESETGVEIRPPQGVTPPFRTSRPPFIDCSSHNYTEFVIGLDGHSTTVFDPSYVLLLKERWYTLVFGNQGRVYFRAPQNLPAPTDSFWI